MLKKTELSFRQEAFTVLAFTGSGHCLLNLSSLHSLDSPPGGVVRHKELAINSDPRLKGATLNLLGKHILFRTFRKP